MPHGQGTGTDEADLIELIASIAVRLGEVEAPKAVAIKKAAAAYKVPAKKLMGAKAMTRRKRKFGPCGVRQREARSA